MLYKTSTLIDKLCRKPSMYTVNCSTYWQPSRSFALQKASQFAVSYVKSEREVITSRKLFAFHYRITDVFTRDWWKINILVFSNFILIRFYSLTERYIKDQLGSITSCQWVLLLEFTNLRSLYVIYMYILYRRELMSFHRTIFWHFLQTYNNWFDFRHRKIHLSRG